MVLVRRRFAGRLSVVGADRAIDRLLTFCPREVGADFRHLLNFGTNIEMINVFILNDLHLELRMQSLVARC